MTTTGYVYKIYAEEEPDLLYIGSTKTKLCQRLAKHKSHTKQGSTCKLHSFMREHPHYTFRIRPIERFDYEDLVDRRIREDYWITKENTIQNGLNGIGAYFSKEKKQASRAKYQAKNKEKIKEYFARYKVENKEKYKESLARFRKNNPEKINAIQAKYRKKNFIEKRFHCECCNKSFGAKYTLQTHFKTKKHARNLGLQESAETLGANPSVAVAGRDLSRCQESQAESQTSN